MLSSLFVNNFFAFIIVLFVVVLIHELGHYLCARLCNIDIETFSIGFGKKLFGFKDRKGTMWQIAPIPLGGFVRIRGQDASFDEEAIAKISKDDQSNFVNKNSIQKAFTVIGGPLFNMILALIVIFSIFAFYGAPNLQPIVSEVVVGSPAEIGNIKVNDKILEVNGIKVNSANDIIDYFENHKENSVVVKILSNGDIRDVDITLNDDHKMGIKMTKIENSFVPFNQAFKMSAQYTYHITKMSLIGIKQLFVGESSVKDLGGIVQIAKSSGDAMRSGMESFLFMIALLSINLAILNMLPIPGLDGGHLLFYLLDMLYIGRFIRPKVRAYAVACGFMFLIGLMIFTNVNDIFKLMN